MTFYPKLNALHYIYPESMYYGNGKFVFMHDEAFDAVSAAVMRTDGIMLTTKEGWGIQFRSEEDMAMFKLILNWKG